MRIYLLLLLTLLVFACQAQTPSNSVSQQNKPFVLGITETLHSVILNEDRILNIYLPDGYTQGDTTKYPVVYLLDGSADEDFIHIAGLYQYYNFPWIERVPKSIIVGIANVDRKRDFTYPTSLSEDKKKFPTTGGSAKFMDFLEKELQPGIEKRFPTNGARTIIGQSLAGLVATEILFKRPELFDHYIIISPSLWWDDGSLLKQSSELLNENYPKQTAIYVGVGKEGLSPGIKPHMMESDVKLLVKILRSGKSRNVNIHYDFLPTENHATLTHQAVYNAIKMLYPEKKAVK
jgi:uncharacterized protein